MILALVSVFGFVGTALGAEWAIDTRTQSTIIIGIGSLPNSDARTIAAIGQNGVGNFAKLYDSASNTWTKSANVNNLMVLDAALTASGNAVLTGMGTSVSTDGGKTFQKSDAFLGSVSQDAHTYGADSEYYALVGSFTPPKTTGGTAPVQVSGVATSTDDGATFQLSAPIPEGDARYGSFPSESTWYVSQGMWDTSEDTEYYAASAHVKYSKRTGAIKLTSGLSEGKWPLADSNSTTNWWGGVSKTTDGGKTWKQVLRTSPTKDYIYFNQISCSNTLNCVVVGEGMEGPDGPQKTVAYTTFDGGETWETTLSGTNDVSMGAVTFVTATEAWLAGVGVNGRNVQGQFYHSTDSGKTWAMEQTVDNCVPMDIDFGVEVGTAACVSSSGASSFVAFYK